jgi:CBS domain-containing protein
MTISQILEDFKLSNLVKHKSSRAGVLKSILDVHESTPLHKALVEMKNADILAVPVYRNSAEFSTKIYTGIVSVHEILSFGFFQDIFNHKIVTDTDSVSKALNKFKKETFFNTPLKAILESRAEEPVPIVFSSSDSISSLLNVFAKGHHRALVVSADIIINGIPAESSVTMLTQLDLLAYFYDATLDKVALPSDFIEPVMTRSLFDVTLAYKRVIAVCDYQPALAGTFVIYHRFQHYANQQCSRYPYFES